MNDVKISVIVTVYNIERYIGECLDSVLNQEFTPIEVICVDDASSDKSYQILKEYEKKDKRVRIICNEVNLGQASSRNRGCRKATGEYLYIMDGDDLIKEGALKRLYECANAENLDILTFAAESFPDNQKMELRCKKQEGLYIRKHTNTYCVAGAELFAEMVGNGDGHGNVCLQFINRKFFEDNQLYWIEGLRYSEDDPFTMYMKAKRAKCIPDILYMRRVRENSMITSPMKLCHLESTVIQFAHDLTVWQESMLPQELNSKIEKHFIGMHNFIISLCDILGDESGEMPMLENYPMAKYIYNYFIQNKPTICKNLTKQVMQDLLSYKNVIVYGAGQMATVTIKFLENNGICDYFIAVTEKKDNESSLRGREIYSIDELVNFRNESIVIIATLQRHYEAIAEKLKSLGFKDIIYVD